MDDDKGRIDSVFRERNRLTERYSLANPGNLFNFEHLLERIKIRLESLYEDLGGVRMLDLGSGELFWTEKIVELGLSRNNSIASDLLHWRLAAGRKKGRSVDAVTSSAAALPFNSSSFDLVSQLTMMTSVLDHSTRGNIATEIKRVLKPGGYILWYDFRYNNPFNKNTRAIGLPEIRTLFKGMTVDCETVTLLPQLARKLGGKSSLLLNSFYALPILRTHYLALIGPKG